MPKTAVKTSKAAKATPGYLRSTSSSAERNGTQPSSSSSVKEIDSQEEVVPPPAFDRFLANVAGSVLFSAEIVVPFADALSTTHTQPIQILFVR